MIKKFEMDFAVVENNHISPLYSLLILTPTEGRLPECAPGQFVQVEVPNSKGTYLRRPISINFADHERDELWLLVRRAGEGTAALTALHEGAILNLVLPLGHGFTTTPACGKALLVGGGVGVAPLLELGKVMSQNGIDVEFLLGARSSGDLLEVDLFKRYGKVHVATEDGSMGEKGFVTQHSALGGDVRHIACCGPQPMMKAVAKIATERGIDCEVSLENMMACGLGACLCCVEDTADSGNVCVCKEGPVFNIKRLKW